MVLCFSGLSTLTSTLTLGLGVSALTLQRELQAKTLP